jgi:dihydrofolate reductase
MRKVIVLEHISLDGVIQAGGGPDEDTSNGFLYGGWAAPFKDEAVEAALMKKLHSSFDLLLGRKTFDIWAAYWPQHGDFWPGVNTATKYVASNTMTSSDWQPSVFLSGDVAEKVAELKQREGPDLHIWGSSNLLQTLMKNDLIDALLANDLSGDVGRWKASVCGWHDPGDLQGDGKHSRIDRRNCRELRACRGVKAGRSSGVSNGRKTISNRIHQEPESPAVR